MAKYPNTIDTARPSCVLEYQKTTVRMEIGLTRGTKYDLNGKGNREIEVSPEEVISSHMASFEGC